MSIGAVRPVRAMRQHETFVGALEDAGASIVRVPFVHGAYDSVFAKDNAVVVQRQRQRQRLRHRESESSLDVLLGRFKFAERRLEQRHRARALVRHVLGGEPSATSVHHASAPLEGGDVVMLSNGEALLGYGFRSSPFAAASLGAFLRRRVVPIELRDPRLYHLDMAVAVLSDGTALVCAEALTPASFDAIAKHPSVSSIVRVPLAEALLFGVNLVQVNDVIFRAASRHSAPITARAIEKRGFDLRHVDLDQFHLAGGSAACLVSRIHPLPPHDEDEEEDAAPQSTAA